MSNRLKSKLLFLFVKGALNITLEIACISDWYVWLIKLLNLTYDAIYMTSFYTAVKPAATEIMVRAYTMITVIAGPTQTRIQSAFHSRRPELRYNDIFRYFSVCFMYICLIFVLFIGVFDVSVLGLLYSSTYISLQDS